MALNKYVYHKYECRKCGTIQSVYFISMSRPPFTYDKEEKREKEQCSNPKCKKILILKAGTYFEIGYNELDYHP